MGTDLDTYDRWYRELDFTAYEGKWVGMHDGEVVAAHEDLSVVAQTMRREAPGEEPFVFYVPAGDVII